MTTNDRRKTFNTPLEFWQWAIMEPQLRVATDSSGRRFYIQLTELKSEPRLTLVNNPMSFESPRFPLTATHDEHGAIEEPRTSDDLTKWLEELAHCAVTKDVQEIFSAASSLAHEIRKHIDERIAAATVQDGYNRIDGGTEWRDNGIMRLKPKGESK